MSGLVARTASCWTAQVFPVGVAEPEERAAVALVEDGDLARLAPSTQELLPGGRGVGDTPLQTPHRARRHLGLRRQVSDHDRAARAGRGQLCEAHLLDSGVMVEGESHY